MKEKERMPRARRNPLESFTASQLGAAATKILNAIEADWRRYSDAADAAYEAGMLDEAEELSVAADALADEYDRVLSAIQEGEQSDPDEGELELMLAWVYEKHRRGEPGFESQEELAENVRWHLAEVGLRPVDPKVEDLVGAAYDAWLRRKKLLGRIEAKRSED